MHYPEWATSPDLCTRAAEAQPAVTPRPPATSRYALGRQPDEDRVPVPVSAGPACGRHRCRPLAAAATQQRATSSMSQAVLRRPRRGFKMVLCLCDRPGMLRVSRTESIYPLYFIPDSRVRWKHRHFSSGKCSLDLAMLQFVSWNNMSASWPLAAWWPLAPRWKASQSWVHQLT